jgi:hypothetical protein
MGLTRRDKKFYTAVPPDFRRIMPSAVVRSAAGTLSFCAAMSISAFRAVAAACRF